MGLICFVTSCPFLFPCFVVYLSILCQLLDIKCSSGSGERRGSGEDRGGMKGEEAIVGILYERRIKKKKNIILTLLREEIDKLILPLMSFVTVHESGTGRQSYVS